MHARAYRMERFRAFSTRGNDHSALVRKREEMAQEFERCEMAYRSNDSTWSYCAASRPE